MSTSTVQPDETETLLRVKDLQKVYRSKNHTVRALGSVDFTVRRGEFVCVVGPSGAGKTTLLRCIAGLLQPSGGEVRLAGEVVDEPPADMAVVFQEYGRSLYPWMSVADNVELPLKAKGIPAAERRKIVDEALRAVDLADVPRSYPWQLSGGMQQRVAIARSIAYRPAILLMDEPFAAVDAQTRSELEDLVRKLWEELGVTVLFVTHDIDESVYLGGRVIVLSSRPTVVLDDVIIDLPATRDQLGTRSSTEFAALRARVYQRIQEAKSVNADSPAATATVGTSQ